MNEDELIEKLKQNDNDGYRELYDEYYPKLYYTALKILGNSFDAQDAIQITFIKINSAISKFEKRSNLKSWIYRVMINVCNDILRQKKKTDNYSLNTGTDDGMSLENYIFDENGSTEDIYLKNENKDEIINALQKLSKKQRDLIVLREFYNLSYKEISYATNTKEGTVKSGLNRAKRKLKNILEKEEQ